jgi:hypothetical protein
VFWALFFAPDAGDSEYVNFGYVAVFENLCHQDADALGFLVGGRRRGHAGYDDARGFVGFAGDLYQLGAPGGSRALPQATGEAGRASIGAFAGGKGLRRRGPQRHESSLFYGAPRPGA